MTGSELINLFKAKGFNYSKEQIFNLYIALLCKPFVILSGISGSGKSKIIEILAEICSKANKDQFELIPVKPNWRDSRFIFGFHNLVNGSYNSTPILNLIIRASENPSKPYFLILDEMNLAKVEHYFADFLSLMETRRYSNDISNINYDYFKNNFSYPAGTKLSEAIVMSCLHANPTNELLAIQTYREDIFSLRWEEQFSGGNSWTAQFRSELNQKDDQNKPQRLAGKLFQGSDGYYQLRDRDTLPADLQQIYDEIKNKYDIINTSLNKIVQQKIVLHDKGVLKTDLTMNDYSKGMSLVNVNDSKKYYIPSEIELPLNLFIVGTVNMDETTHNFSPKVLDRANVIEMNEINVFEITQRNEHVDNESISNDNYFFSNLVPDLKVNVSTIQHTKRFNDFHKKAFDDLFDINKTLKKINRHFGYRVYNEISNYVLKAVEFSDNSNVEVATDLQILQKILPKLNGSAEQLFNPLMSIFVICFNESKLPQLLKGKILFEEKDFHTNINFMENPDFNYIDYFKYPRSAKKLFHMISDLLSSGFTSFIQ
jgi:energy-coupling factor transporter ATP-binding protein EcfA2